MKKGINVKGTLLIFLALFIIIIAIDVIFLQDNSYEGHFLKMDTSVTVKGVGSDMDLATRDILNKIDEIDFYMSAHNVKGNLYKLNTEKTAPYHKETAELITLAQEVQKRSDNAFCIAVKPVMDIWGFGTEYPAVPKNEALTAALEEMRNTEIAINNETISLNRGKLDLGGIAKGHATDKAREILDSYENIDYAVLDFGGNILTYGEKPDGSQFKIGINDGNGGVFATVSVDNKCVITSGGYERYFEENGAKYHHIIDPETGYPAKSGLVSVTIISDIGALGDALSTACYVLGFEKGAKLAESYGVEAVFLDENKNVYTVGNVEIEILSDEYTLQ